MTKAPDPVTPEEVARRLAAYVEHGNNQTHAARALGIARETLQRTLRKEGIIGGMVASAARDGGGAYVVKGVSTYFDGDGNARGQWIKTKLDDEKREAMVRAAIEAMAEPLRGMGPITATPAHTDDDLLVLYPWGDPHFGLHCWGKETGDDFDLAEAERLTCAAVDRLVAMAPNASQAILLNLGDMFHMDDQTNATPGHGHQLDADTRFAKVLQVGVKAVRWAILRMLQKHARVRVRNVPGNHDPHASLALALAIDAYFDNDPRVTVDLSPGVFTFYRFGKVLLGECHGDTTKPADLPGVMMNDAREHISATEFWHWNCGHIHHDSVKEYQGVVVETHRTLAPKDAWHAKQGYRSGRTMKAISYHREHGEVSRLTCDVSMLRAA